MDSFTLKIQHTLFGNGTATMIHGIQHQTQPLAIQLILFDIVLLLLVDFMNLLVVNPNKLEHQSHSQINKIYCD